MKRLSNNAIQIDAYDPCYCGSDKKVKFCHPMGKRQEILRPSPSNCRPPGPKSGFANSGCYARKLDDCGNEMSGEHLFSETMLKLLTDADGKLLRAGYPWQQEGEVQQLTPATCKANVLCKRHNNALSPLDTTGGRFLRAILSTPDFLQNHELRVLLLSGDDFERWILKTLCTHIVATRKFGDSWEPPLAWIDFLWGMSSLPPGCGLYYNQEIGNPNPDAVQLSFRVLTCPGSVEPSGAIAELAGYQFALAMIPPSVPQAPDSALVPKYYRPSDFVISYGESEVVYSFGWAAPVTPQRIGISWAPAI
jgi:hypothetical protein